MYVQKNLRLQYNSLTSPRPLTHYKEERWTKFRRQSLRRNRRSQNNAIKNTKVKVRSLDRGTDYFDIVRGLLQGNTSAPYLVIICLDYVLRTSIDLMKENGLKLAKERSRRYPAQTITDVDYANDIALLANTPVQSESLIHSLERAADSIGLHVNTDKTEYMCFNQRGEIYTQKRTYLQQRSADTKCSLEDLLGAMDDWHGWRERVKEIRASSVTRWWWLWWWYQLHFSYANDF